MTAVAKAKQHPNIEAMQQRFHLELVEDDGIFCLGNRTTRRNATPWTASLKDLDRVCRWALPVWSDRREPAVIRAAVEVPAKDIARKFLSVLKDGPLRARRLAKRAGLEYGDREKKILRILFKAGKIRIGDMRRLELA